MTADNDRALQIANAAGLAALGEKHLAQLANSVASGRELSGLLPKDLHWREEIALTFRLPGAASVKR
jgi:hypothetical protein